MVGDTEVSEQVPDSGGYMATIEKVITRVNIGSVPPRRIGRRFSYRATLRYGDNVPAADGTRGVLQWRRGRGGRGPRSFKNLAFKQSVGGVLRFRAKLPGGPGTGFNYARVSFSPPAASAAPVPRRRGCVADESATRLSRSTC